MSKKDGYLHNPHNGFQIAIYRGFNFPCLLLGCIWFLSKSMIGWALVSFVFQVITFGFSNIIMAMVCNNEYRKFLLSQGYFTDEQFAAMKNAYDTDDNEAD